ncbi:UDP-4-amino-4,6-dideoxy-N-acetyl-beta-L-altrosamine transaminase [Candidatus Margulisiibacteriota bacterium]
MKSVPYATQWIDKDDVEAVSKALNSDYLTQGPRVAELENRLANYCGAKYAVALNSGTSALHAACFASEIGKGDEVITSPITFVASANCVLYCGGKPVFADINEDTINIDPDEISKKITKKTRALIPVHFAGYPAALKEMRNIAKKHNLLVIEDACHALGAEYESKKIGAGQYSDMVVLSFHAVKHITTGEGGMVLTNDDSLYRKLLLFRSHGITRQLDQLRSRNEGAWYYEMQALGFNYRITDIQCALGLNQLKKLSRFIRRRKEIVSEYDEAFSRFEELKLLPNRTYVGSAHHLYVLQFKQERLKTTRKRIFEEYRNRGIGVNVHYIPVYAHPYYKKLGYRKGLCPKAEKYYQEAITLPLFPKMTNADVKKVIKTTKIIVEKYSKRRYEQN